MLTEIYIKALLVNEKLADQAWDAGMVPDELAAIAWYIISCIEIDGNQRGRSGD